MKLPFANDIWFSCVCFWTRATQQIKQIKCKCFTIFAVGFCFVSFWFSFVNVRRLNSCDFYMVHMQNKWTAYTEYIRYAEFIASALWWIIFVSAVSKQFELLLRCQEKKKTIRSNATFILFFWQHTVVDDKICPMNMERPISLFNFMFGAWWVLNLENNNLMSLGGFNNDKIKTMINHQDAPILRHIYS